MLIRFPVGIEMLSISTKRDAVGRCSVSSRTERVASEPRLKKEWVVRRIGVGLSSAWAVRTVVSLPGETV